jgi:biopolymer transport protein TolR
MSFSTAGSGVLRAEINITPMIDILLVLMIVFMVAVTMSGEKGLQAEIPQQANSIQSSAAPATVVIQLNWTGGNQAPSVKINEENVKWKDLHARLFNIFKQRAERIAFVKGDDDVAFQYVADAISIARDAGVERVGLLMKAGPETR